MGWTRAIAMCAALLAVVAVVATSSPAHAQTTISEKLRLQGIYSTQPGAVPPDDVALQALPEIALVNVTKRSQLRATYLFTATAHSRLPTDIANRVILASAFDLSKRTSLLLSLDAGHSTVTTALVLGAPANAPTGAVPIGAGQLVTGRAGEGLTWEASRRVRFTELADFTYVRTLNPPPNLGVEAYLANGVLSLDRVWVRDAVGVDLRGGYAQAHFEPLPESRLIPLAVTPHWRHDISRSLTSLFLAGATVVVSPDPATRSLAGPYAQATLDYIVDSSTFNLTAGAGTTSNAITAQLIYAEQLTLRTTTALSVEHHLVGSAGVGYTHGELIELRRAIKPQPDFDSFIADAGLAWSPKPTFDLFVRYQFVDQITATGVGLVATPALQRHAVILGIQISTRPDVLRVPTQFAQRVDGSDAAVGTSAGASQSSASPAGGSPGGSPDGSSGSSSSDSPP